MNWKDTPLTAPSRKKWIHSLHEMLREYSRIISPTELQKQVLDIEQHIFNSTNTEEEYHNQMSRRLQEIKARLNPTAPQVVGAPSTTSQPAIQVKSFTTPTQTAAHLPKAPIPNRPSNPLPQTSSVPNDVQVIDPNYSSATTTTSSMNPSFPMNETKETPTSAQREELEKKYQAKWMQLQAYKQPLLWSLRRIDIKDKTKFEEFRKKISQAIQVLNTHPSQLNKSDIQTHFQSLLNTEQFIRSLEPYFAVQFKQSNKAIDLFFDVLKTGPLEPLNTKLLNNALRNLNRGLLDNGTLVPISKQLNDDNLTPEKLFWWESSLNLKKERNEMVLENEESPVISFETGRSHSHSYSHDTTAKQHKGHQFYSASPLFEAMRERIAKWCEDDLFFKPLVAIDENTLMIEELGHNSTKLYISFTRNLPDLFPADPQKVYFSSLFPNFSVDRTLFPLSFQRLVNEHRTEAAPYIVLEDFLSAYKIFLARSHLLEEELLPFIHQGMTFEEFVQGGNVFLKCTHSQRQDLPVMLVFIPREYPTSGPRCQFVFTSESESSHFLTTFYRQCCERQKELLTEYSVPIVHNLRLKDVLQIWISFSSDSVKTK